MALAPKRIITKQVEIVRKLGLDENLVLQDGFDEEGITILGAFPEQGDVFYNGGGDFLRTLIRWSDDSMRDRAMAARMADWLETVGMTEQEWEATTRRLNR